MATMADDIPKVHRKKLKDRITWFLRKQKAEHNKAIAAGLDIGMGIFGVHRLYLGTAAHVPVVYTLTLGGGGFLVVADLGIILLSKDLEQYANHDKVLMWSENN